MRLLSLWKTILWAIVVTILSLTSGEEVNRLGIMNIPHFDKVAHFGMYFIFTFLLIWDLYKYKSNSFSWRKVILLSMVVAISFGGIMELLQEIHTIHRSTDIKDFIANSAGVCAAAVAFRTLDNIVTRITLVIRPKSNHSL